MLIELSTKSSKVVVTPLAVTFPRLAIRNALVQASSKVRPEASDTMITKASPKVPSCESSAQSVPSSPSPVWHTQSRLKAASGLSAAHNAGPGQSRSSVQLST
jgi:hypothetical protein